MDAKAFERTVRLGLGRAVLHLRENDSHPYREIILDACLHNTAYDPQIDGTRAAHAMDLLRLRVIGILCHQKTLGDNGTSHIS